MNTTTHVFWCRRCCVLWEVQKHKMVNDNNNDDDNDNDNDNDDNDDDDDDVLS